MSDIGQKKYAGNPVLSVISTISVAAGTFMAHFAQRFPARVETLETCAGYMLIGGLFLIGSGLPVLI
ncbi:MAG: hypothetical protein JO205_08655 [Pseudolabrys sp.]|nr:hypothetical protein [Pseudolabrys sp.]